MAPMTRETASRAALLTAALALGCHGTAIAPRSGGDAGASPSPIVTPAPARTYTRTGPPVLIPQSLPRQSKVVPSPDGLLAVALGDPFGGEEPSLSPRIVDFDRSEVVGVVDGHSTRPGWAEWSSDGRYLVTWGGDLVVTDTATGQSVRRLEVGDYLVCDRGALSPALIRRREPSYRDDDSIAEPGELAVLDAVTGNTYLLDEYVEANACAASPTEALVMTTGYGKLTAFRDGHKIFQSTPRPNLGMFLRFSADGAFVATGSDDRTVEVLSTKDFRTAASIPAGPAIWHPSKNELLSRDDDKVVWYDVATSRRSEVEISGAVEVAFEPSTGVHLVLDEDGRIHARRDGSSPFEVIASFDPRRRHCSLAFERGVLSRAVCTDDRDGRAASIALAQREERPAAVVDDGTTPSVTPLNGDASSLLLSCVAGPALLEGDRLRAIGTGNPSALILHFDPSSHETYQTTPANGGASLTITKLDPENRALWSMPRDAASVELLVHPSRPLLAVMNGGSSKLEIRSSTTGALIRSFDFDAAQQDATLLAWHPTDEVALVAVSSIDDGPSKPHVEALQVRTGQRVATLPMAHAAEFSPDGLRLLSTVDGRNDLWDGRTFARIADLSAPGSNGSFAFDGQLVSFSVRSGEDERALAVLFVDSRSGRQVQRIEVGAAGGTALANTSGGRRVFAVERRHPVGSIGVWDLDRAERIGELPADTRTAKLSVMNEGRIVTTSTDGRVRLLRVADGSTMFVHAVEAVDGCRAVAIDPQGRFEGALADADTLVRYRLGDDLRTAKTLKPSDAEAASMRVTGSLAAFLKVP